MKQYVLDEPMAAAPLPAEAQAMSLTQPGRWRWWLLAIPLEAVALAILYVALNGLPAASTAASGGGVAYAASFSFPREAEAVRGAAQAPAAPAVSRVRQERGRYVVELHGESPAAALAMLAEATKARVGGSGIFAGSALRLTRSLVATSPREAWQAVFGDVANFAIACAGSACEVRFVSLVKPGAPAPRLDSMRGDPAPTDPEVAPTFTPPEQASVAPPPLVQTGTERPVKNGEEN
ncbi:MAG TPA: hypothetical protein VLD35_00595 [Caldimonas sp.]|nr:hypothetical protein [Caldimonas sp.]